jgi:membrane-associated phospholipid phosphatase
MSNHAFFCTNQLMKINNTTPTFVFCCLAILLLSSQCLPAQHIDINLLKNINRHETAFKNDLFATTSSSVYAVAAGVPVGMFTAGLIKKDKQLQIQAAWLAGGYLVSAATAQVLKRTLQRNRPFVTYPYIVLRQDDGKGYSLPSNHATGAFYMATSISLLHPKWYVIVPAYSWAALVGYGRMYQGAHYPSDVLAGAILGAGTAWLGHHLQKKLTAKKKATKQPGGM